MFDDRLDCLQRFKALGSRFVQCLEIILLGTMCDCGTGVAMNSHMWSCANSYRFCGRKSLIVTWRKGHSGPEQLNRLREPEPFEHQSRSKIMPNPFVTATAVSIPQPFCQNGEPMYLRVTGVNVHPSLCSLLCRRIL